jgi:hypothetical protein
MNPEKVQGDVLTKPTKGAYVSNVSSSHKGFQRKTDWLAVVKTIHDSPQKPLSVELTKLTKADNSDEVTLTEGKQESLEKRPTPATNDGQLYWNTLPDGPPSGGDVGPFNQKAMDIIRGGGRVPVWSDVLGEWLWWVRDEDARQRLLSEGCEIVIYTLGELELVAGWDAAALKDVHAIKKRFGTTIEPTPGTG